MTVLVLLLVVIALALVGAAVIGLLAHLIWWAIVGLVIGALARLVVSGTGGLGFLKTVLFGIAGALLGGLLAGALDVGAFLEFLLAVAAAATLIALFGTGRGGRALDLRR